MESDHAVEYAYWHASEHEEENKDGMSYRAEYRDSDYEMTITSVQTSSSHAEVGYTEGELEACKSP